MTRKLSDLYVVGKEVVFDDEAVKETVVNDDGTVEEIFEEPVKVWLQKLVRAEQQEAVKKAGAKKSLFARRYKDEGAESEDVLALRSNYAPSFTSRETLKKFLLDQMVADERAALEAQVAAEDRWAKDEYLAGLFAEWESHLKDDYNTDEPSDEALEVYEVLLEYLKEVSKAEESFRKQEDEVLDLRTTEELDKQVMDSIVSLHENIVWLTEFRRQELFHAVRKIDDHRTRYFDSVEGLDEVPDEVSAKLALNLEALTVSGIEGKD